MLTEQDIDLVKLNMYKVDNGEISFTSDTWLLEVIGCELHQTARKYVDDPRLYKGTFSRVLILMQWSNIIQAMTCGGRTDCYFNATDFKKIMAIEGNDTHRLTIKGLNNHFKWIETLFKEKFIRSKVDEELKLGRLEEVRIINIKEE